MRNQRSFSLEFKRQVVEDLLSGESRPAQLCRRYNISSSLLYHWKRQYSRGRFTNEPTEEAALKDRIENLERLWKLAENSSSQQKKVKTCEASGSLTYDAIRSFYL